jgi:hypothetical protein
MIRVRARHEREHGSLPRTIEVFELRMEESTPRSRQLDW